MGRFDHIVNDLARSAARYAASSTSMGTVPEREASLVKLNANESVYGPSPKAVEAMRAALNSSHLYPDDSCAALRAKLAERHGIQAKQILIANGLTALLGVIARTLLRPGTNAVTSACSFISYPMVTHAAGAQYVETPLRDGGYDLNAILAAINADTRVVFLANPNNPTGTLASASAVDEFLQSIPKQVLVVLDEAYFDYAHYFAQERGIEYSRALGYVREDRNVVVLRTFSKAHGLAGVRVGYGVGPVGLMAYFSCVQDVFAVSDLAQAAALAALDDDAHVQKALQKNSEQVEWMQREIAALGYRVIPTWTNFVTLDVQQDCQEFARKLRQEGVLVRPLAAWGAPTSIRVTLGTAQQNQTFVHVLAKLSRQ
jgi:histidinol-phosphate aminotransferase